METTTTTIKGRQYTVEAMGTGDATRADLIRRGFDGECYSLRGARGAYYLGYRRASGEFEIVTSLGRPIHWR